MAYIRIVRSLGDVVPTDCNTVESIAAFTSESLNGQRSAATWKGGSLCFGLKFYLMIVFVIFPSSWMTIYVLHVIGPWCL